MPSPSHRFAFLVVFLLLSPAVWAQKGPKKPPGKPSDPPPAEEGDLSAASAAAHEWLKSQMLANGMVNSYQDGEDVCYTYDQAVAATAFVARGDTANARKVLDALRGLQTAGGYWAHSYLCSTGEVLYPRAYVGAAAWVVLAVAHYEATTGDDFSFRTMALRALDWMLLFMQYDGGINGGLDENGVPLPWASTEHNQDAYASLRYFGYDGEVLGVRGFLDHVVWDAAQKRWWQGRNDPYDPLDVNPLGVLNFGAAGTHAYGLSLEYADLNHRSIQRLGNGRNRVDVDGFDFNSDRNDIWLEGSGQMAAALHAIGMNDEARYFTREMAKTQTASGGIPYSLKGTHNGDFRMSTAPSVAGTGWFILAAAEVNPLQP